MITRNFTEEGELITSGKQFETGANAVRIKMMRCLRKVIQEDRYDVTNGIDIQVLTRIGSNEAFVVRYLTDYLCDNIPEIERVVVLEFKVDKEEQSVKISVSVQTQEGGVSI